VRFAIALAACTACVQTSVDTDGHWSALDESCVPIGPTRRLVEAKYSVVFHPAGRTLLYSPGESVSQLDLATGESKIVLRSDGISEFGTIENDLVYYESDGNPEERRPIDVILDHGARSTSRYERISPEPGRYNMGLLTTPHGIYWQTSPGTNMLEWRWNPETREVESFPMDRMTIARVDDTSLFYFDVMNRLVVRPQTGGPPTLVVDDVGALMDFPPNPLGIDGDEVFYVPYRTPNFEGDLVARKFDGTQRVLASDRKITQGTIDSTHVYFTEDCGYQTNAPFDPRCQNLYRIPRAGGPIETVFEGEDNTDVFDVQVDACNVYWQQFTIDGSTVYGREITP
jgi:hypothetical protein